MITVLRLGHRPERDKRITTHVALAARAFGAQQFILVGDDEGVARSVRDVAARFGGPFDVALASGYRPTLKHWEGVSVHLTMYGAPLDEALPILFETIERRRRWVDDGDRDGAEPTPGDLLIVVGAQKVPGDVYELVDHNVAVGNQPHSEVAALAVFLDRLNGGEELHTLFDGALVIAPRACGKSLLECGEMHGFRLKREGLTASRCISYHREAGTAARVLAHCVAVRDLAVRMALAAAADVHLVELGALLHDIGRSESHGLDHALRGARLIRDLGLPEALARIAQRHIGAGLDDAEAAALGLPDGSYLPETLEEKIVAHADTLIRETTKVPLRTVLDRYEAKGLDAAAARIAALHRELAARCDADPDTFALEPVFGTG